jgi:phosphatidate phosphatase APP1
VIEAILDRFPERKFILVGDSGEHDPEVYAALLRQRPEQILKIYIRNVTREDEGNERFRAVFEGIGSDRWQLFEDPKALSSPGGL